MKTVTVNHHKYLQHEFASKQIFIDIFGPKRTLFSSGKGFFKIYGEKVIYNIRKEDLIAKVENMIRDARKGRSRKYMHKLEQDKLLLSKVYPLDRYIKILQSVFGNFFSEEIVYDIVEDTLKDNIRNELAKKGSLGLFDDMTAFAELTMHDTVRAQVMVIANEISLHEDLKRSFIKYGPSYIMGHLEEYPEISKRIIELSKKYYFVENDFLEAKRLSSSYWICRIQTQLKQSTNIEEEIHDIYFKPKELKNRKSDLIRRLKIPKSVANQVMFLDMMRLLKSERELLLACEIGKLDFIFRQIALKSRIDLKDFYMLSAKEALKLSSEKPR